MRAVQCLVLFLLGSCAAPPPEEITNPSIEPPPVETDVPDIPAPETDKPDAQDTDKPEPEIPDKPKDPPTEPTETPKEPVVTIEVVQTDYPNIQEQRIEVKNTRYNLEALEHYLIDQDAAERKELPRDWKLPPLEVYKREPWCHAPAPHGKHTKPTEEQIEAIRKDMEQLPRAN